MITADTIRAAILAWLETELGITIIYADKAAPRPATPYASIKLVSLRRIGFDHAGDLSDVGIQDFDGDRVLSVSVQVFGNDSSDPIDLARSALNGLSKQSIFLPLAVAGLAPLRQGGVNDLTALADTEWEPRAQFDQEFALTDEYTDDVGLIEHVEGSGTVTSPNKEHTVDFTAN
jgi:hypothetical protein